MKRLTSQLKELPGIEIGLYRDDGLAVLQQTPKATEKIKKEICSSRHCKMLDILPIGQEFLTLNFQSPITRRNVHENSSKIGRTRLTRFFSFSNAPMTPEGHWYACVRGRLEIVWRHKHANQENTRSLFSCFLWWNFLKVCMLRDIDAYITI